ncbi:MAG: hypothetical protein ABIP16_01710 [Thermomonas sp.]
MRIIDTKTFIVAASLLGASAAALASNPLPLPGGVAPWNSPKSPGVIDYAKAAGKEGKQLYDVGKKVQAGYKELKEYEALTNDDKRMEPNYQPPNAPNVPSKCLEDKACRPCYDKAYGAVNKTRKNLEKVRAHYDFTHRFTTQGKAFMQGVANQAGGVAAAGAQVEAVKIDASVAEFDKVVQNKNAELLGNLEKNLREVSVCEAKFYKNDDWYDRFGYIYYQFMVAHYDYVQTNR